jgi:ribonuclease P protein component
MAFDQFSVGRSAENVALRIMRLVLGIVKPCEAQICGEAMNRRAARLALTDGAPYKPREFRRSKRETHLSTEQARAQAPTRLSHAHGDKGRPQGHRRAPRARPQAAFGLKALRPTSRAIMQRLKRRADFLAARDGARAPASAFFVQARDRHDDAEPRVGLTVTKKAGSAVERNRIRRRLREAAKNVMSDAGRRGFDYVLVARREALGTPFAVLVEDLERALKKVHAKRG